MSKLPSNNVQTEWTETELLASDEIAEPLVAAGVRCHGGFDAAGEYRSPRTRNRSPAIDAWQRHHREQFGTELIDVPLSTWPESYPNVAQAKFLLRSGVREPMITVLTRIGTVEGFGAMIRYADVGDIQRFFDDSITGTATAHLNRGLFEAHARDEAGFEDEAGHKQMWFAARDIAFEEPITEDQTATMLERMGLRGSGGSAPDPERIRRQMEDQLVFTDLDFGLEMLVQRMIGILLIEISAFHTFAWAEAVLSDADLVAGDGDAARVVSYIRRDETPHVEYLKTAITEMRDRTFVGESGRKIPGTEVVGELWDRGLADSLGPRREQQRETTRREIERAVRANPGGDDLLEELDALSTEAQT
ncbi:MAG: hypothetical protein H0V95_03390 [Actinobacteria bacterium]|nr:hypothetical protein [Actinomycetota bacterium]